MSASASAGFGFALIFFVTLLLACVAVHIISCWKINQKAGRQGWAAIVPVYNVIVMLQVAKLSPFLAFVLLGALIPYIGLVVSIGFNIVLNIFIGKAFNKKGGFIVGMILLSVVFYPILAFGKSKYNFDNSGETCQAQV